MTDAVAELIEPGGPLDLGPQAAPALIRMLRLLAGGAPVRRERANSALAEVGVDPDTAETFLNSWAERTEAGDVVGLALSANPTPHRVTVDGVTTWAVVSLLE